MCLYNCRISAPRLYLVAHVLHFGGTIRINTPTDCRDLHWGIRLYPTVSIVNVFAFHYPLPSLYPPPPAICAPATFRHALCVNHAHRLPTSSHTRQFLAPPSPSPSQKIHSTQIQSNHAPTSLAGLMLHRQARQCSPISPRPVHAQRIQCCIATPFPVTSKAWLRCTYCTTPRNPTERYM